MSKENTITITCPQNVTDVESITVNGKHIDMDLLTEFVFTVGMREHRPVISTSYMPRDLKATADAVPANS